MTSNVIVLSLSQSRTVTQDIHDLIKPHGYAIGGVLQSDPFDAHHLALVLRVLEPRPQALVIGRGYSKEEADEARKVFATYVKENEPGRGTVIKITDKNFAEVGKEGIPTWTLNQLDAFFKT